MGSPHSESAVPSSPHIESTTESGEDFLGLEEVARILGCTPDDVRVHAREGNLRARRMGTHWRFRRRDVLDYLSRLSQIGKSI